MRITQLSRFLLQWSTQLEKYSKVISFSFARITLQIQQFRQLIL